MRINGTSGALAPATAPIAKRGNSSTFSISEDEASAAPAPAGMLRTVGGIDVLIALQGVEDPTERRKKSFGRGRNALDALDELKIGLLGGTFDQHTLGRLKAAAEGLRDGSGDPGLDGVLAEIELRVEVELAKAAPKA